MLRFTLAALITALTIGAANAATRTCNSSVPVNTLEEMYAALFACWEPPAGSAGMSMTLRFSLRRDGTMISEPRITYKGRVRDDPLSKDFEATIISAVRKALPVPFTNSMAGAVAGRPMSLLFRSI
jgi:hypothetical protein